MSRSTVISMWAAVLLLTLVYAFPLWEIRLQAPQYPQGLGIDIWVHKITGAAPHDLQNINGLNHYIGMKAIEPGEIAELRYMRFVLAGLIVLGALVAFMRRRAFMVLWVVLAIGLSVIGMMDFHQWEYSYGHELNPDAAIKIPGMSYQPPMFGTKQLLNFTTTAWPGLGGICAILAVAAATLGLLWELWRTRRRRPGAVVARPVAALIIAALWLSSCSRAPQPIAYGRDACTLCRMTIADQRYGAEIVTEKGRVYKFDSVECMARAADEELRLNGKNVAGFYTVDFAGRGSLIDVATAAFVHSDELPSPMGMNLTSFSDMGAAQSAIDTHGGEILDWPAALKLVRESSLK